MHCGTMTDTDGKQLEQYCRCVSFYTKEQDILTLLRDSNCYNLVPSATMEHAASGSVKEQLQTEMTIKTVTVHTDSDIKTNSLKPEPVLVHSVKSEPALLVKEEILEDSSHDECEQQCGHDTATLVGTGGVNKTCSTSLDDLLNVKYESADIDIGPTVLQHMDVHCTIYKHNVSADTKENSIVDDCNEAMPGGGVKKGSAEDKWGGFLVPQKDVTKKQSACRTLQKHQLTDDKDLFKSICSVQLVRLNTFQCDLCGIVYTEKLRFFQHFQSVHRCHFGGNKATSQNCAQTTTEGDYDEAHMKSLLGLDVRLEKVDLHKHLLHQHCTSSTTSHKPQLLSASNKLHQRNSREAVPSKDTSAGPSNLSGDKAIKTKQNPFACDSCEKGYSSKAGLNLHKRSHSSVELKNNLVNYEFHASKEHYHHDEKFAQSGNLSKNIAVYMSHKPFQCKICHAKFAHRVSLTMHMRVHTGEKPYECDACHATFSQKNGLTMHTRVHTGEKPYECINCQAKFARRNDLTKHNRIHTGEKPYDCDACHAKFAQKGALTLHNRIHTGEKPYECDACHAKFAQKSDLTTHTRVHTGEKPYECITCHAKFAQRSGLTRHMSVHTGEKPYKCDKCHAKFARRSGLTTHSSVHTVEKPYECDTCHAKFSRRRNLTKHMRVHTGEKPFECHTCRAKFARKDCLITHMRRVHTGE